MTAAFTSVGAIAPVRLISSEKSCAAATARAASEISTAVTFEFGVSRAAVLDIVFGDYEPTGRLPIQMPKDMDTVEMQSEDKALDMECHVDEFGNTYDYGFGLNYSGVIGK